MAQSMQNYAKTYFVEKIQKLVFFEKKGVKMQ